MKHKKWSFPFVCVISWVQLQVSFSAQSSYIQVHRPLCRLLTLTVLPSCNSNPLDVIYIQIVINKCFTHAHLSS